MSDASPALTVSEPSSSSEQPLTPLSAAAPEPVSSTPELLGAGLASSGSSLSVPGSALSTEFSLEDRLRQRLAQPLGAELQQELARLLHLRVAGATLMEPPARDALQLALHALLADEPNLHLARTLRRQLESWMADRLHPLRLGAVLRTDSPTIQVMLGITGALILTLMLGLVSELLRERLDGFKLFGHLDINLLIAALLAGILGAVTSVLVRIRNFEQADATVPASRVMLGFTKPLVGAAFSVFGLVLLKSQLLPIKVPASSTLEEYCFFLALSFALGFSERLGQDMLSQVEERFAQEGKDVHTQPSLSVSSEGGELSKS